MVFEPTWKKIIYLLRWDKPAGRLILIIPALWAVFLAAEAKPDWKLVLVIILGAITTSAAGCVVNDLWDRNIDPQVERTKIRPLASKALTVKVGIITAIAFFLCAAGLAFYFNPWTNPLSFWLCVAAVPVIIAYPLAKRFFPVPQLVLAIAWGFAVLISWSAVTQNLSAATWLLWGATVFWTLGFDTIYALSDRDDDLKIGINSSAIFFGKFAPEAVGIFFVLTAICLAILGRTLNINLLTYGIAWAIAVGLWFKQYLKIRKPNLSRKAYNQLFEENVIIGFILLSGMITSFIF
ncbi:4-hydroxybenzoate octaprenyltransferase [Picosynechococcus sp. PCC 7003]|uniref:4-hydroxybenzoate solanesyltransferase n=1 Tax=Picosynechococcus sp. PCC 7003 TaxID=374981 RepID=UPI0008107F84|nr:4-hydroxybenzoate solanesyltransferase [Picosynechococcus sp. PCC 7003]ANV84162.1 4-hydroxybenzoate octaprenyltransferase [Picosynechococcus sp. PCC 7003]